jgi:hypothetical protein
VLFPGAEDKPKLLQLAKRQLGVLHRRQLDELDLTPGYVSAQLSARRWSAVGHKVVVLQNAPLQRDQLLWLAVLDAEDLVALGSHTSLELGGFTPIAREAREIHLVVTRGAKVSRFAGIRVHESRRLRPQDVIQRDGLPCTGVERSAIDAAAWQPFPRFACLMLAAVVQQRLTSAARLDAEMRTVGRVRHKAYMRLALLDIADGAQSLGELDLATLCRRFGLVPPIRQVIRRDAAGRRRYLDAEWRLPNGEIVVLEVDGSHHLDVANWQADMKRERSVVVTRRRLLRATAFEVRLEAAVIAADLRALGVPSLPELSETQRAIAS